MSAPILRLSTSQRLVFLVNSRLGLFTAAMFPWLPFSRSYGVILPSSLTKVFPLVLGFSPHLPVSVYGTGDKTRIVAFLGSMDSAPSLLIFDPHHTSDFSRSGFAYFSSLVLARLTNRALRLSFCVPTSSLRLPVQESPPVVHRLRLSASP